MLVFSVKKVSDLAIIPNFGLHVSLFTGNYFGYSVKKLLISLLYDHDHVKDHVTTFLWIVLLKKPFHLTRILTIFT